MFTWSSATLSSLNPVINPLMGLQTLCSSRNTTVVTPFSSSNISLILPMLITLFTWKKYQHHGWFHWTQLYNNNTLNSLKRSNIFKNISLISIHSLWLQHVCFLCYTLTHSDTDHPSTDTPLTCRKQAQKPSLVVIHRRYNKLTFILG